jgi:predicted RNase H-like HicB family nuclease
MRSYIALIHKDGTSDYGVSFPDFPGCVSAGSSLEEARANAEEALALHLAGMKEDGDPLPEPSDIEAVMAERENRDAVAFLMSMPEAAPKIVRINITVPEDALQAIDRHAEAHGLTRSGFLVSAARDAIRRRQSAAA